MSRLRSHVLSGLAGGLIAGLVVAALPAIAGDGDPLLGGRANFAMQVTQLRGWGGLRVTNTTPGGEPAAWFLVESGPPFVVNSAAKVSGLNADRLDGLHAAAFARATHGHDWGDLTSGVPAGLADGDDDTVYTDGEAVAAVLAADGDGSGLDADHLDGMDSALYLPATSPVVLEAARFQPVDPFDTDRTVRLSAGYWLHAGTKAATLVAPVRLPDGATITSVALRYFDYANDAGASVALYRKARASLFEATPIANAWATNNAGTLQTIEDDTIAPGCETVDNSTYTYYVQVTLGVGDLRLYEALVGFTGP